MLIAGIDPGSNGAIAVLDSLNPDSIALLDLKKKRSKDIWDWLKELTSNDTVWIEDIHSMYGMSAKSNFGFGRNLGIVTTIAEIILGEPSKMVTPKVWQKYIGVTVKGKAIKKEVAEIAQVLYPNA